MDQVRSVRLIVTPARAAMQHLPTPAKGLRYIYLFIYLFIYLNLETKYNAKAIGTYRHHSTYKSDM